MAPRVTALDRSDDEPPRRMLTSASRSIALQPTAVMGVLNVTPDSFSDGGRYTAVDHAIERALDMAAQGARIIDIGGESTRPGAAEVTTEVELARVMPVIEALRDRAPDLFMSLDTSNPVVMRAGCDAGVDMINDVRGLEATGALETVAAAGAAVCVMHRQGEPATMQNAPAYAEVVDEVRDYLAARVSACRAAGVSTDRIAVDPGFGFGKTLAHNLALLRAVDRMSVAGCPVLMGVSRKSMFAKLFARDDMDSRINGSLGAAFWAASRGVGIIRCHDVRETAQMVELAQALGEQPIGD